MDSTDTATEVDTNIFYKSNEKLKDTDVDDFNADSSISEFTDNLFADFNSVAYNKSVSENVFEYNALHKMIRLGSVLSKCDIYYICEVMLFIGYY